MPTKVVIADKTNSAGKSTPAARPAVSQAAKGKQGAETGTEDGETELPSAAEVAAALAADPDAEQDEDAEVEQDDDEAETPEADEAEGDEAEASGDEAEADESESEEDAASGEDEAGDSDDENTEEETETEEEQAERPAKRDAGYRFDVLTKRAKDAEEEAAKLREQMAARNYSAPQFGPLEDVDDLPTLQRQEANEYAMHKWALENEGNPDGGDLPDGKGGTMHFEPEQIRKLKVQTWEVIARHIPARRAYLQQKESAEGEATAAYPWLRQLKEGDGAAVQKMIETRPYLRLAADYRTLAADAHIGAKLRKAGIRLDDKAIAALSKGKVPAVKPGVSPVAGRAAVRPAAAPQVRRTAPSPSRPGVLPPRLKGREAAARLAEKRLSASAGGLDDIANSIAARMG